MFHFMSFCLLVFVLLNTVVNSATCTRSADCDDSDPKTVDLCWIPASVCFNIAEQGGQNRNFAFTSLDSVLKEAEKAPLSLAAKREIVSAAARFMAELNPHRFLQLNVLKVDIVAVLRRFLFILPRLRSNVAFHVKIASIFQLMNDRHTVYRAPAPLRVSWASMLFNVFEFFDDSSPSDRGGPRRRYVIAETASGDKFGNPAFEKGAEILKWNGEQIENVVLRLGRDSYGSNPAAQISNALPLLTNRYLGSANIPFERFTEIQFRDVNGSIHTIRAPWYVWTVKRAGMGQMTRLSMPYSTEPMTPELKQESSWGDFDENLFSGHELPSGIASVRLPEQGRKKIEVKEQFKNLFRAEIVSTKAGPIGHLTFPSFQGEVSAELVGELSRILRQMPKNGLVIDIRNNRGESADFARLVTELISDKEVAQQRQTLRASKLTLQFNLIASKGRTDPQESDKEGSLLTEERALRAGEAFTGPLGGLFSPRPGGKTPRAYSGPVVTLVNGLTYGAGDVFADLQENKNSSLLVGTSDNVGAGGATFRSYSSFVRIFPSLLKPLPVGADFSTSVFRNFRTSPRNGAIMEYFGVKPKIRYYSTLNDAVNRDCDLFEFLGKTLASRSG